MAEFELLASAAFGMEAIVVRELAELGYPEARVDDGRVRFRGDLSAICRTNLWLRCAERVQVVLAEFPARNFDDLFDQIKVLPWEDWLPVDAKFPVTARCVRSEIRSVPNTQKMVKRAIVERLRKVYSRHWFAETGIQYDIEAIILGDRTLLTIDTTGDGLHKRGYRHLVGRAPLRETVAAAMVKLSYWHRDRLLVDPFCGSGTIPIEAALIGRNLAPGRNRSFSAEQWPQIPRSAWTAARQEVKDLELRQPLGIPIIATDRDRSAIRMATQHARQAGVETEIHLEVKDFVAFPTNRDAGILICNPPYGERLGAEDEVRQLYRDMGELLRPLDDWSLYILTGAEGFEREFGKTADRRRKLYNARIACTYYQYLGPKPVGINLPDEPDEESALPAEPIREESPDVRPQAGAWNRPHREHRRTGHEAESATTEPISSPTDPAAPEPPREQTPPPRVNPWANARRPQVSHPEQKSFQRPAEQPKVEAAPQSGPAEPASSPPSPPVEPPVASPDAPAHSSQAAIPDSVKSASPESNRSEPGQTPIDQTPIDAAPDSTTPVAPQVEQVIPDPAPVEPIPPQFPLPPPPAKSHPWKKNPWPRS